MRIKAPLALCVLLAVCAIASATETENQNLAVLPASGSIALDGRMDGWDLSGGLFACGDVEHLRDQFSLWVYANYDADNLYVLAKWKDPTPLNNPEGAGGHAFNGDCLQLRFILFPDTPEQTVTWWDFWRDKNGKSIMERAWPGPTNGIKENPVDNLANAEDQGARQTFKIDADGKGYTQVLTIPWKLLSASGKSLKPGDKMKMTIEPNFTAGSFGRITIKDLFDEKIDRPDRIFTFRAFKHWGWATLEPTGNIAPKPVRLADGRTFAASMVDGAPSINWTGLIRKFEWPGFQPIALEMPMDGYVSLNIRNGDGQVVRHLLNWDQRQKGAQTVQWDGLTDATYRTPGVPVPAGHYTWKAIAHPGAKLTFRGYADYGGKLPWESDATTMWLGDHGVPSAVVTDGKKMYLACDGAEGGRHLLATDLDGNVVWGLQNTTGAADPESIAVDNGKVYILHPKRGWMNSTTIISVADAERGTYLAWQGKKDHLLTLKDIYGDQPAGPDHFNFIDARDGKIYLTSGDPTFYLDQVTDWKAVAEKLKSDKVLGHEIVKRMSPPTAKRLDEIIKGTPLDRAMDVGGGRPLKTELEEVLNEMIHAAPDSGRFVSRIHFANSFRSDEIDRLFAGAIQPPAPGDLVILDGSTGRIVARWPFADGGAIRAVSDHLLYVVQGGDQIVAFNPASGESKPFVHIDDDINGLTTDAAGNVYASLATIGEQVAVFDPHGKELRRIGRDHGRAKTGAWQPDGMINPAGIAVDAQNKLWVMEEDRFPKRVSVWSLADGKFAKDFFGPPHYGNSGAVINPRDPNLMVSVGCEWRMDPKTGKSVCLGTFDREYAEFATYREGKNGKLYLFTISGKYGMGALKIFERVGDANFVPRTQLSSAGTEPEFRSGGGTSQLLTLTGNPTQAASIQIRPGALRIAGSNGWSLNLGLDMSLYVYDNVDQHLKRLPMTGFTPAGAPKYDLTHLDDLPAAMSDGYEPGMSCALPSADNTHILINLRKKDHPAGFLWTCFDLASGKQLWTYPNPFFQVHGSHNAPAADPGLFRGAYGAVGAVHQAGVGDYWIINGNVGEWGVLSSDGYYVSRLFNGNIFDWKWPTTSAPGSDFTNLPPGSGGEDFGGSATQGDDGNIYVQAGKCATWNLQLTGLEKTVNLPGGTLTLSEDNTKQAMALREIALQAAAGSRSLTVKNQPIPFTGNLPADFKGCDIVTYQKSEESTIRTALAHDATTLYVGWEVKDPTPWINGAKDISQMYVGGDTVDLQLATDPAAKPKRSQAGKGDIRISIGNFQGTPTAVLYRYVSDEKKPRTFTSGVVKGYQVDYVDVLADAKIKVKLDKGRYVVEAAIPLSSIDLSLTPGLTLGGDVGATFNEASGTRTKLRSYWSNQQTGLVDDVVFELQATPANWGKMTFE